MSKLTLCSHSLEDLAALRRNCQVIYRFFTFICTSLHFLLIYGQIHLSHHSLDEIRVELTAPASRELQKICLGFAFTYVCVEVLSCIRVTRTFNGLSYFEEEKRLKFLELADSNNQVLAKETSPWGKEMPLTRVFNLWRSQNSGYSEFSCILVTLLA